MADLSGPGRPVSLDDVLVVVNPVSGRSSLEEKKKLIASVLSRSARVVTTRADGDAAPWLEEVDRKEPSLIVAMGGDGTVLHVVDTLRRRGARLPVAHAPLGTANAVANALGFPQDPRRALEMIPKARVRGFDVGVLADEDRCFLVATAAGLPVGIIESASREAKSRFGALAYLIGTLERAESLEKAGSVKVRGDDGVETILPAGILIALNLGGYGSFGIQVGKTVNAHDGRITVAALAESSILDAAWATLEVVAGNERRSKRVWVRDFRSVEFEFSRPSRINVDGEQLPERTSLSLRCAPDAVDLVEASR